MKRIVATLAVLFALALPAGVLADTTGGGGADIPPAGSTGGMTVELRSVRLATRAIAQVEVAVTCQPKPASEYPVFSYWEDAYLRVAVRQPSGRSITAGSTDVFFDPNTFCDGTAHILTVGVAADVPFKTAAAAVGASGAASYSFDNWETGEGGFQSARASTGWVATKIGR